jgi:glutamyl-tRNA reductase
MGDRPAFPPRGVATPVPDAARFPAVAASGSLAALRALTLNHRTVGLGALADSAFSMDRASALHARLHARRIPSLVLATCNRTELYWRMGAPGDDEAATAAFVEAAGAHCLPVRLQGAAVADHLFRVCSGLESLVLGEAEILGQVRAALDACRGAGPFLTGVVRAALRTGRAARAQTGIGNGAMSVASAAVKLLASHVPLARSRILVIGAGATGLKVARHVRALGATDIVLANRTLAHAEARAHAIGATPLGLEAVAGELARADAIVGAAAAPAPLVTAAQLLEAQPARAGRPLVVVDLSMPPVIEPAAIAGLLRLDLQAVERHVAAQRARRAAEVPQVEALIARELAHLETWARQQALRPLVAELRRTGAVIRQEELARVRRALASIDDGDPGEVVRRLVTPDERGSA